MNDLILLSTGLTTAVRVEPPLPTTTTPQCSLQILPPIIVGHGLGPKNPKDKSHANDKWVSLVRDVAKTLTMIEGTNSLACIAYTARGHGNSHGWEDSAATNPTQFTWQSLSTDMIAVANYYEIPRFIASGSSMGSATALYTAIQQPERVAGVVMIRPPTAWNERRARRKFLLSSASKCAESEVENGERYHLVLQGAALSDLPDPTMETDQMEYKKIQCPVLLLTIEGDDTHPVSTAKALHDIISTSTLHIAANIDEAATEWPAVIQRFLLSLQGNS